MSAMWRMKSGVAFPIAALLAGLAFAPMAHAVDPDPKSEQADEASIEAGLAQLKLPPGFHISLVTAHTPKARELAHGAKGTIYSGSREDGTVFEVIDGDGDGRAETVNRLVEGLYAPNGVAFKDGTLYLGEINRISKIEGVEDQPHPNAVTPVMVKEGLPSDQHHGLKFIRFGPDGKL